MNDYLNGRPNEWYARYVISESDGIAAAYSLNPDAAVTTCGEWSIQRLVQHVGSVQRWATHIAEHGTAPTDSDALKAPDGTNLAQWLIDGAADAARQLQRLKPESPLWNPWPVPQIAGVWPRRMAQETALHRYDAALAIGQAEPIDAGLASDGIDEYFVWAVPRAADDGAAIPSGTLHVHCTDVEGEWWVHNGERDYEVVREHRKGDAALRGTAHHLLLRLWGRPVPDDAIEVGGDAAVAAAWLAIGGR